MRKGVVGLGTYCELKMSPCSAANVCLQPVLVNTALPTLHSHPSINNVQEDVVSILPISTIYIQRPQCCNFALVALSKLSEQLFDRGRVDMWIGHISTTSKLLVIRPYILISDGISVLVLTFMQSMIRRHWILDVEHYLGE